MAWKDEQFKKDYEEAKTKTTIDNRPIFCGIPASDDFCKLHSIEPTKEAESLDYYKVFQACIDLLNRRGMVSKINRVEELESIDFEGMSNEQVAELENLDDAVS